MIIIGKNLKDYVNKYKEDNKKIPENMIWEIMGDILHGFHFFHKHGMTYRNLELEDVIMNRNGRAKIKIGLRNHDKSPFTENELKNPDYRCENDMFSIGQICYSLCCLEVS